MPIFLTGDFNTSLTFFTQSGWTPTQFQVISEAAKKNGTALSVIPDSGYYDHIFGTGSYTIRCYAYLQNTNFQELLSDHPFAYADFYF
jgi:endonuclease/exonuclease/phosphatase family metal-dependent hydrolase